MSDWIVLDDKVPQSSVEVLICTDWGLVTTDTYSDRGYSEGFNNYCGCVVAWQPLPTPISHIIEELNK